MQDLNEEHAAMQPFERLALAHIAQELLWDPGLIPLTSFSARQRAEVLLMLRRLAAYEPSRTERKSAARVRAPSEFEANGQMSANGRRCPVAKNGGVETAAHTAGTVNSGPES